MVRHGETWWYLKRNVQLKKYPIALRTIVNATMPTMFYHDHAKSDTAMTATVVIYLLLWFNSQILYFGGSSLVSVHHHSTMSWNWKIGGGLCCYLYLLIVISHQWMLISAHSEQRSSYLWSNQNQHTLFLGSQSSTCTRHLKGSMKMSVD